MDYENLELDELEQEIQQMDQHRAELEKALEQRLQQAKYELAQEIKDLIVERGHDVQEIVSLIGGRKRPGAAKKRRVAEEGGGRQYTKYVDPDDPENTYSRGVLPAWMKQKMQDAGYDSSVKEDRDAFKANCLNVMEG